MIHAVQAFLSVSTLFLFWVRHRLSGSTSSNKTPLATAVSNECHPLETCQSSRPRRPRFHARTAKHTEPRPHQRYLRHFFVGCLRQGFRLNSHSFEENGNALKKKKTENSHLLWNGDGTDSTGMWSTERVLYDMLAGHKHTGVDTVLLLFFCFSMLLRDCQRHRQRVVARDPLKHRLNLFHCRSLQLKRQHKRRRRRQRNCQRDCQRPSR